MTVQSLNNLVFSSLSKLSGLLNFSLLSVWMSCLLPLSHQMDIVGVTDPQHLEPLIAVMKAAFRVVARTSSWQDGSALYFKSQVTKDTLAYAVPKDLADFGVATSFVKLPNLALEVAFANMFAYIIYFNELTISLGSTCRRLAQPEQEEWTGHSTGKSTDSWDPCTWTTALWWTRACARTTWHWLCWR